MLNNEELKKIEEQYKREKGLRERYDTLVRARTDLKSIETGYQLNSILCHLPNDIVAKAKEYIEQLVQHEIDVSVILDYLYQARCESLNRKYDNACSEWRIANDEVEKFKKQYIYGKKLSEVPMDLIQKGAELERKERNAWNKCEEISKQLDEMYRE